MQRLEPDDCPPIDTVHVGSLPGEGACRQGFIVINPHGTFYRAAQCGDLLLAMVLAHEYWHARNGSDERVAMAASRAFLERHRA